MNKYVVHCKKSKFDIYIGRPSIWGNPFVIGKDGTREDVVRKYREYILQNRALLNKVPELKGKILGCFCSPEPCHGDVLSELINTNNSIDNPRGDWDNEYPSSDGHRSLYQDEY